MAGILEGAGSAFDAGHHKRSDDGVHAYGKYVRHFGIPHQQQDKALRYNHPGKHQLIDVELRSRIVSGDARDHRYNLLIAGQ